MHVAAIALGQAQVKPFLLTGVDNLSAMHHSRSIEKTIQFSFLKSG
jgi:hypothetical protein